MKITKLDRKYNYLITPVFTSNPPDINLTDLVITYNTGTKIRIINLTTMLEHVIVYDKFFDTSTKKVQDISITCCPVSLTCVVYFGKWELTGTLYQDNILLKQNNQIICQLSGQNYDKLQEQASEDFEFELIRRSDCKIMNLKNAITIERDCEFLADYDKLNISSNKNYDDLIYGIEYISGKEEKLKYTMLVPKPSKNFDIATNNIKQYLEEFGEKIKNKAGLIITSTRHTWELFHPDTKIVNL